jgi:phage terminase large subunit-like protein
MTRQRSRHLPETPRGMDYAATVAAGKIPTGIWVKKAGWRFLADLKKVEQGKSRWMFDPDHAIRPIQLAARLHNIKGPEAGQLIELLPFQRWLIINLFGFIEGMSDARQFRQASIWMPRGTMLAAVMALYTTFLEGEGCAEGYTAAVSRDQAKIVFDFAKAMTQRNPEFREQFSMGIREHAIHQTAHCFAVDGN